MELIGLLYRPTYRESRESVHREFEIPSIRRYDDDIDVHHLVERIGYRWPDENVSRFESDDKRHDSRREARLKVAQVVNCHASDSVAPRKPPLCLGHEVTIRSVGNPNADDGSRSPSRIVVTC